MILNNKNELKLRFEMHLKLFNLWKMFEFETQFPDLAMPQSECCSRDQSTPMWSHHFDDQQFARESWRGAF